MSDVLKPISIEELRERAYGTVIKISDWTGVEDILPVRVRSIDLSPYLLSLKNFSGLNKLKAEAIKVFEHGDDVDTKGKKIDIELSDAEEAEATDKMVPILDEIAKACLLEPTYQDFLDTYPLTLAQKIDLFSFAIRGVKELETFRKKTS